MSLGVAIHNSYEFTCEICTKLRSVLLTGLVAMVAFSEAAGRASKFTCTNGKHEEAKSLMLGKEIEYKENNYLLFLASSFSIMLWQYD